MIYSSPVGLPLNEKNWASSVKALMNYPNIHFRNVQLKQLSYGTPLEDWIENSDIFKSDVIDVHISDIMRILLLYKYGGTYSDLDYMILKRLDDIGRNWIPYQSKGELANALFDCLHSGIGHIILHEALR